MSESNLARVEYDHGPPSIFGGLALDSWQQKFILAFIETKSLKKAGVKSKIHNSYHYRWKKENSDYLIAYEAALEMIADQATEAVRERGIEGWEEPLSHQGRLTGDAVRKFSDNLAMFWIKGHKSEYKDNFKPGDINIKIGVKGNVQFNFDRFQSLIK